MATPSKVLQKLRKADEALDVVERPRVLGSDELEQSFDDDLAKWMETYQESKSREAPILDELEQEDLVQSEKSRAEALTRTDSAAFHVQTRSPEEFRQRYQMQLSNPKFAAESAAEGVPELEAEVAASFKRDAIFQSRALRGVLADPRQKARAMEIAKETAYVNADGTPRVMVHVDRWSDPYITSPEEMIQFPRPKEIGVHSGTNEAATSPSILGGFDPETNNYWDFTRVNNDIEQMSGMVSDPIKFEDLVASSITQYFNKKFSRGAKNLDNTTMFEDLRSMVAESLEVEAGFTRDDALREANNFMRDLRQMPTANSTPHFFLGKNGLLLQDNGGFGPETVHEQLRQIFNDAESWEALDGAMSAVGSVAKQEGLRKFIEDKGFDHIVYHNSVEDKGSTSIINWKPELMVPVYGDEITNGNPKAAASAAAAAFMGMIGLETTREGN